ncbi:hypothetical protein BFW01_g8590 [Lasiodiplodia theobromae]|uniref:Rhodopsin domain-containing protein n=1 Tax=Lasiodiplodia theobromae TaxID=45133 RepID=A0A5N5D3B2_9PEZI|nr:Cation-transporting ATPase 4 protein [Lasiodiplodia theobromae]KAB2572061.1 hypothetical protein DBV05_g9275 [Lasiodiplodia theobromae]KAF4538616.1 Cation-transporting ATPase 4 protein [Lasiodiplodia theobromae]KAF9637694.1 hypothetical protein BFW01_g8590 [Lasiodiplodia theobromae]
MALFLDNAPHVAGSIISITILAFTMYGLRVYTRLKVAAWGMDDWCMTVAIPPFAVLSASCIAAAFNGVGVHAWRFNDPAVAPYMEIGLKWFFMFEVFYCVAIIPIKLSIAFQLIRIAAGRKFFVYSQYVVAGMFTTMNLIAALYIIFQCKPVSYAWNTNQDGKCEDAKILTDIYYATTAVNIATDWFCAAMPIPLLWNVKLNRNAKISVACILSLGIFASLSACIRLKYTVNLQATDDYLYAISDILIWGYAENGIGVIVGCVGTLRPLFRKVLHLGSDSDGSTPMKYGGASSRGDNFPSNARRTYDKFDSQYELEEGMGPSNDKYGAQAHETEIRAGTARTGSLPSDSDSQKQILDDSQGNGIMVHSQVQISRD